MAKSRRLRCWTTFLGTTGMIGLVQRVCCGGLKVNGDGLMEAKQQMVVAAVSCEKRRTGYPVRLRRFDLRWLRSVCR
jgi:hypothetical protein